MSNAKIDQNSRNAMTAVTDDVAQNIENLRVNPTTKRLKVEPSALDASTDNVGIANIAGDVINPATEEKQDTIISRLDDIKNNTSNINLNVDTLEVNTDGLESNQTSGQQKAQIVNYDTGHNSYITHFHELQVSESTRLAGTKFEGSTKDTNFWTETVAGTGSVTQTNGSVVIATGSTANSTSKYVSVRLARFVPATVNVCRHIVKVSNTGSANNKREWGMADANNGIFFQLSGTTFSIITRRAGNDTAVTSANFNKDNTFVLDTNFHEYEIRGSYSNADFFIDDVLVHQVAIRGSANPLYDSLTLPVHLNNANSGGGTADVSLTTLLSTVFRIGKFETAPTYKHITTATTTICKYGPGMLHVVNFNNPTNNAVTIYNNTAASGEVIAVITPQTNNVPFVMDYHVGFSIGLTIVTAGTPDLTIIYE